MKNVLTIIVVVLIILLFSYNCRGDVKLPPKKEYQERIISRDSSNREIQKRQIIIDSLLKENEKLSEAREQLKKEIEVIKNRKPVIPKTVEESAEFYNNRYDTKDNYFYENYVKVSLPTNQQIIKELQEKDNFSETIPKLESYIFKLEIENDNLKTAFNKKREDEEAYKIQIQKAENTMIDMSKTEDDLRKVIESVQRKNKNSKYYIIGGFVGGVILGTQLVR